MRINLLVSCLQIAFFHNPGASLRGFFDLVQEFSFTDWKLIAVFTPFLTGTV
jgi:hypothetical protein